MQLAKEELVRKEEGKSKGKRPADAVEEEEPADEKARLLESEYSDQDNLVTLEEGTRQPDSQDGTRSPEESSPITDELPSAPGPASSVSEKARGKRRAQRSMSTDATGSLERIAAVSVGKNGFVPTQEWVRSLRIMHFVP